MSRTDFLALTPAEFESVSAAWVEAHDEAETAAWLRTRRLAAILIRPHIKRGIPEDKLIPLPCDKRHTPEREQTEEEKALSEARLARFRQRMSPR